MRALNKSAFFVQKKLAIIVFFKKYNAICVILCYIKSVIVFHRGGKL